MTLTHLASGKVRDLYEIDDDHLLIVASDRISAFDWVLPTQIPDKGRVLTALSVWWFDRLADIAPHHLVSIDDPRIPAAVRGRAMLVRKLTMVPIECVARGYLSGSGTKDYRATGAVCGIELPAGLLEGSKLPEPIFTPATKAPLGEHDENITLEAAAAEVGPGTAAQLRRLTLAIYARGRRLAEERGIILADTKLEFGFDDAGVLTVGDEVLTPDSSRFWPADTYVDNIGRAQPSYDKQYLRDWLTAQGKKGVEGVDVPEEVVRKTGEKYREAFERITGGVWGA